SSPGGSSRLAFPGGVAGALRVVSYLSDRNRRGRAPAPADRLAAAPRVSGACRGGRQAHSPERLRRERCQPSSAGSFHVECTTLCCLLRSLPFLARDDVGTVPPRPVVLRSRCFVRTVPLFCLSQKLCQSRDIHIAQASSGKSRLDLLEQPAVAVRVAERGERAVTGVFRRGPADSTAGGIALKLGSGRPGVED